MPGEHCPLCGAVRAANGCACAPAHPDVTETAVLPHTEGPPLVRPYVPAAHGHAEAAGPDPFATTLMPPVADSFQVPPPRPAAPPPYAAAPYPAAAPPVPVAAAPGAAGVPGGPDLGVFSFRGTPPPRPGGRAERREKAQLTAGRRRTAVIAAGLGIAAVGAGLAFMMAPSSEPDGTDVALPLPSGSLGPEPPTGPPSAEPSASGSPSAHRASPSAARSASASASAGRSASATGGPASATAGSPVSSAPVQAPTTAAPVKSTAPAARTLKPGDTGADVTVMQQMLYSVDCGRNHLNSWFVSGTFDTWTQWVLSQFQTAHHIKGPERDGPLYGPKTQAELQKAASAPGC